MKAELRIGNLVTDKYYDTFKTIIEVDSMNSKGINLFIEDDGNWAELAQNWIEPDHKFEDLFGIPLTEEWLLLLNFKQILSSQLIFRVDLDGYEFELDGSGGKFYYEGREVKAVHQLQNLVYALTGEELTLK